MPLRRGQGQRAMILGYGHNEVLTVVEMAGLMGISTLSVEALTRAWELPAAVAADGRLGITRNDLKVYLDAEGLRLARTRSYQPTVLVADRDPNISEMVDSMLMRVGIAQVLQAGSKSEVKHLMDGFSFDLILLNRTLAGSSGGDTARWIRVERADWRISIIMMSGWSGFLEEYQQRHSRFADACLLKPFGVIDLMLCILRLHPWHRLWQTFRPGPFSEEPGVSSSSGEQREAASV